MAKYQYRISTDSLGTSNYGFAYFLIFNPSGSGRKFTLRSLEVQTHSVINTTTTSGAIPCSIVRCAGPVSGENMVSFCNENDSSFSIPSTCVVRRNAITNGTSYYLGRIDVSRRGGAVGGQLRALFGTPTSLGKRGRRSLGRMVNCASGGYNNESIFVRQNEAVCVVADPTVYTASNPVRVSITLNIDGKTANWSFNANTYPGESIVSVENTGTNAVSIVSIGIDDLGTTDTPTLRIVPVGQMYAGDVNDSSKQITTISKMDSTYPSFPGSVYSDVGFIPYGVPEIAISPASTGTPQNMNYLHTRDFWGPMYRNFLVETCHMKGVGSGIPDNFGKSYGHHGNDLFGIRAGITLNQGEGIAIVNSAETAVGVQAAYGGWQPMTFSVQIDSEPATSPFLTLTGLSSGSDIVILNGSTILQQIDQYSGSSWSWQYDPDLISSADVCVYKPGFVPFAVRNLSLGISGASIPVQQVTDRNYS